MESALSGNMSINRAAELHRVPQTTLQDRLSVRVQHGKNPGPIPYLTTSEMNCVIIFFHPLKLDMVKQGS